MKRSNLLNSVYSEKILEFAGNIKRIGRLGNPDATAKARSKICGSTVEVDLCMDSLSGVVTDFAQRVKACVLGQASSSIMAGIIIGTTANELKILRNAMYEMLKNDGIPPKGRFSDFHYLEPVRSFEVRHASTLLIFDAVVDCIEKISTVSLNADNNKKCTYKDI